MSIVERVPGLTWTAPLGPEVQGVSMRSRRYRLRDANGAGISAGSARGGASLANLPDPFDLPDMHLAAFRMRQAIVRGERICILANGEIDGVCAAAILVETCRRLGAHPVARVLLSERVFALPQGRELEVVDDAFDLVVVLDCAAAQWEFTTARDMDVIVLDHHEMRGDPPEVLALVNPRCDGVREDCKDLATSALAFLLAGALRRSLRQAGWFGTVSEPDLKPLLQLAAVGSLCDVVPVSGASRTFVRGGLQSMRQSANVGISAVIASSGNRSVNGRTVTQSLAPRLDAVLRSERVEDRVLALEVLLASTNEDAVRLAEKIGTFFAAAESDEARTFGAALPMSLEQAKIGAKVIILHLENAPISLSGRLAERLRDRLDMPVLIAVLVGDHLCITGRSVAGFDLGAFISEMRSRGMVIDAIGNAQACKMLCEIEGWPAIMEFVGRNDGYTRPPHPVDWSGALRKLSLESLLFEGESEFVSGLKGPICHVRDVLVKQTRLAGQGDVLLITDRPDVELRFRRAVHDGLLSQLSMLRNEVVSIIGVPMSSAGAGRPKIAIDVQDVIYR